MNLRDVEIPKRETGTPASLTGFSLFVKFHPIRPNCFNYMIFRNFLSRFAQRRFESEFSITPQSPFFPTRFSLRFLRRETNTWPFPSYRFFAPPLDKIPLLLFRS